MSHFQPWVDFFTFEKMIHPVTNHPPAKASFIPSKWEKMKVFAFQKIFTQQDINNGTCVLRASISRETALSRTKWILYMTFKLFLTGTSHLCEQI